MQPKIKIVDALCGAGKTTWVFKHMLESNPKDRWIFVSPYLDEAGGAVVKQKNGELKQVDGRVQESLPSMGFRYPKSNPSKTASFIRDVTARRNVSITHSLFSSFTVKAAEAIKGGNYTLVIDETIDLIKKFEDVAGDDVLMLMTTRALLKTDNNQLIWNEEKYPNYKGRDVGIKELCDLGCLWLYGDKVFVQRIPPLAMKACKEVIILTYMFEGSLMESWLKLNGMEYEYYYPEMLKGSKELKQQIRDNLNLITPPKLITEIHEEEYRRCHTAQPFSVGWYKRTDAAFLSSIKRSVESTVKHNMQSGDVFWTTFIDYKDVMQGKGYQRGKRVQPDKGDSYIREPFVSKNMRASNEYRDCTKCVYMVNVFPDRTLLNHINSFGISLDSDKFALSELIQFMFRGCIRQNKEMDLYILSERMRHLLIDWLKEDT